MLTSAEDDESIGKLRLDGYRQALENRGIAFDPSLVVYMEPEIDRYSLASGYRMTKKLLEAGARFSALYATADTLALGACRALKEAGVEVPADCSVAGFDGLDAGKYYIPQPYDAGAAGRRRLQEATVRHLFQLIRKKEKPRRLFFEGKLVVRESTQEYRTRGDSATGGNHGREN